MLWLYNFGIFLYSVLVKIASIFNPKANLFVSGRKNIFLTIEKQIDSSKRHIWFHFASLGEFEQGRPVLEKLKERNPDKNIVVTFFSPSGYEIRKNYALAEGVFYLPLDTKKNAKKFIALINPELAIFTKYEFWFHYFNALNNQKIPLIIISGIFRPNQLFFKWYGGFYRRILGFVDHFFVQNEESATLLKSLKLNNVSLSGDTRFDRVAENAKSPMQLPIIADFCGNKQIFIAGSTWPQDEQLLKLLIAQYPSWKFIIAPHEIDTAHINNIVQLIPELVKYTNLKEGLVTNSRVLLIDNIGMLSAVYQYAEIAYIGGGFGAGIHNTLEAAAFGLPVIFGPEYNKFQEAKDLISIGAAVSISSETELVSAFEKLIQDSGAGEISRNYIAAKTGSTDQIIKYLENYV